MVRHRLPVAASWEWPVDFGCSHSAHRRLASNPVTWTCCTLADFAGAAGEAKMDEVRAAEVLLGKVARQRAAELTINPIRQRLRGGVPCHLRRVPVTILQVTECGLG